jgi:hypothetical protein
MFLRALVWISASNDTLFRLDNRPSKLHLMDALQSLGSFCKSQRKKLTAVRKQKEKHKGGASASAAGKGKQKAAADDLDDLPPLIPINDPTTGSSTTAPPPPAAASSADPSMTAGPSSGPSSSSAPPSSSTKGKAKSHTSPDSDPEDLDTEEVKNMFSAVTSPESRARLAQALAQFDNRTNEIDEDEEDDDAGEDPPIEALEAILARMRVAGAGAASSDFAAASSHLAGNASSSATSATSPGTSSSGPSFPFYFSGGAVPPNAPPPFTGLDEVD